MAVFLVIDGVAIDGIEKGDYSAYEKELGVADRMADGTRVEEIGAVIWVVEVNYGRIDRDTLAQLQTKLRTQREHQLFFLPDTGQNELTSGVFHLVERPQPTVAEFFDDDESGAQIWEGLSLTFEEVTGHD